MLLLLVSAYSLWSLQNNKMKKMGSEEHATRKKIMQTHINAIKNKLCAICISGFLLFAVCKLFAMWVDFSTIYFHFISLRHHACKEICIRRIGNLKVLTRSSWRMQRIAQECLWDLSRWDIAIFTSLYVARRELCKLLDFEAVRTKRCTADLFISLLSALFISIVCLMKGKKNCGSEIIKLESFREQKVERECLIQS